MRRVWGPPPLALVLCFVLPEAALAPDCHLPCYPFCTSHCPTDCSPAKLNNDKLGALAVDYAPVNEGCISDHAPQAGGANKGTRLLECGVWGCSGTFGCGGGKVGTNCPADDCPPWPAGKPQCSSATMTIEYCIQHCLEWSPSFVYAGMTYGQECWCDVALNMDKTDNVCRNNVGGYCDRACKGDPQQVCC